MKLQIVSVVSLATSLLMAGCSTKGLYPGEETSTEEQEKIKADAYLFDATVYRDGKPTSFRLECYDADTVVGLAGRGYLGKGALRGRVTVDSIFVFFPSTGEYVREHTVDLLSGANSCLTDSVSFDFTRIFAQIPEADMVTRGFQVESELEDDKSRYHISYSGCDWTLELEYRDDDNDPRLYLIEFDDGKRNRLRATRRTFKKDADVPGNRFSSFAPPEAVRIIP